MTTNPLASWAGSKSRLRIPCQETSPPRQRAGQSRHFAAQVISSPDQKLMAYVQIIAKQNVLGFPAYQGPTRSSCGLPSSADHLDPIGRVQHQLSIRCD